MEFSIIIPTHNRIILLRQCLQSIIRQRFPQEEYEVVVVDDSSSDGTKEIVEVMRKKHANVRYFQAHCKSAGGARNIGLKHARGRYIAFTDDDCTVEKDWLLKLKSALKQSNADAVGGSILNPTNSYLARAQYFLNFSAWIPFGEKREMTDIPTANVCYRKKSIEGHCFVEFPSNCVYEDSLFNNQLMQESKKILFDPRIEVFHHTWKEKGNLRKFFRIQEKSARGFVRGGFTVHGKAGRILLKYPLLNLLCPRLILVMKRCVRSGKGLSFLMCLPLIIAGEFYKNIQIIVLKMEYTRNLRKSMLPGNAATYEISWNR